MSQRTYLDYNASAPMRPQVFGAMAEVLSEAGNPSSIHAEGRQMRERVEAARDQVADLVNADPRNVIFTSGGTEANVTALTPDAVSEGVAGAHCFISAIEHPSVLSGGRFDEAAISQIAVNADGVVDLERLASQLEGYRAQNPGRPFMAAVMLANNETGAIQPIARIADLVHDLDGVLHCDCVQAAGKIDVDIETLGADMISLSAHKLGGPQGVGALVLSDEMVGFQAPLLRGGGQELRLRAGTENVAGIVGFGVAAELAGSDLGGFGHLGRLRDELEQRTRTITPDLLVFAEDAPRLANTSCFAAPGVLSETSVIGLDLEGIAVSAGSACSSGKLESSHVLGAMGVEEGLAECAIRVSLGWNSQAMDIGRFTEAWATVARRCGEQRQAA